MPKDEAAKGYLTQYEGLNKENRICELDEDQQKPRFKRNSFIKKHKEQKILGSFDMGHHPMRIRSIRKDAQNNKKYN